MTDEIFNNKLKALADIIREQALERVRAEYPNMDNAAALKDAQTNIIHGKKYVKIDTGRSGKYMVDQDGNIFGVKAYGVINKKRWYGTLDTIDDFDWSGYIAVRIN